MFLHHITSNILLFLRMIRACQNMPGTCQNNADYLWRIHLALYYIYFECELHKFILQCIGRKNIRVILSVFCSKRKELDPIQIIKWRYRCDVDCFSSRQSVRGMQRKTWFMHGSCILSSWIVGLSILKQGNPFNFDLFRRYRNLKY